MANTDIFQMRTEEAPTLPAPVSTTGAIGWMRKNLFSSVSNTILTVIGVLPRLLDHRTLYPVRVH